jgi:hypothetical protein
MITTRIRAIVGMGMLAGALGLSALGAASVANAAPVSNVPQYWVCDHYDQYGNFLYETDGRCQ